MRIQENQSPQKFVVHSGANENRKVLNSKKKPLARGQTLVKRRSLRKNINFAADTEVYQPSC